jgi:hypothetical protein
MQLTDQLQGFTLVDLKGPGSVSYFLPVLPEHFCTSSLSTVSGSVSIETMDSLQNFIHDYIHIHDPATVPQKKEHSLLIYRPPGLDERKITSLPVPGIEYGSSRPSTLFHRLSYHSLHTNLTKKAYMWCRDTGILLYLFK